MQNVSTSAVNEGFPAILHNRAPCPAETLWFKTDEKTLRFSAAVPFQTGTPSRYVHIHFANPADIEGSIDVANVVFAGVLHGEQGETAGRGVPKVEGQFPPSLLPFKGDSAIVRLRRTDGPKEPDQCDV